MENDFQKDGVDDVFSDLDNKSEKSEKTSINYKAVISKEDRVMETEESIKNSNLAFFIVLGIIIALGVLGVFLILM